MCNIVGKPRRNNTPKFLYKVVRSVTAIPFVYFQSEYQPGSRSAIMKFGGKLVGPQGADLLYTVGSVTRSPDGPGVMAYRRKRDAFDHIGDRQFCTHPSRLYVIRLRVPVGAKITPIRHKDAKGYAASRVRVLGRVKT